MDYTTLVAASTTAGSIANWVNSSQAQASASTILQEAEAFIYRRLRHWRMLSSATGTFTVSNSVDYIALPSDYLEDKYMVITGTNAAELTRNTLQEVVANYQYDGSSNRVQQKPKAYFNSATQLKFDSPADQAYPYLLFYYAQPAALSGSNTTNFLTSYYPRLVRCACMYGAAEFMKDSGMGNYDRSYWGNEAEKEIMVAKVESDRSQRSLVAGPILL